MRIPFARLINRFSAACMSLVTCAIVPAYGDLALEELRPEFRGVYGGSAVWGDLNHDGKLDVFMTGG